MSSSKQSKLLSVQNKGREDWILSFSNNISQVTGIPSQTVIERGGGFLEEMDVNGVDGAGNLFVRDGKVTLTVGVPLILQKGSLVDLNDVNSGVIEDFNVLTLQGGVWSAQRNEHGILVSDSAGDTVRDNFNVNNALGTPNGLFDIVVIGKNTGTSKYGDVVIGADSTILAFSNTQQIVSGVYQFASVVVGYNSQCREASVVVGSNAEEVNVNCVCIGYNHKMDERINAICVGDRIELQKNRDSVFGPVPTGRVTAIDRNCSIEGGNNVIIGTETNQITNESVVIGNDAYITHVTDSVVIGRASRSTATFQPSGDQRCCNVVIGFNCSTNQVSGCIAIGNTTISNSNNIVILNGQDYGGNNTSAFVVNSTLNKSNQANCIAINIGSDAGAAADYGNFVALGQPPVQSGGFTVTHRTVPNINDNHTIAMWGSLNELLQGPRMVRTFNQDYTAFSAAQSQVVHPPTGVQPRFAWRGFILFEKYAWIESFLYFTVNGSAFQSIDKPEYQIGFLLPKPTVLPNYNDLVPFHSIPYSSNANFIEIDTPSSFASGLAFAMTTLISTTLVSLTGSGAKQAYLQVLDISSNPLLQSVFPNTNLLFYIRFHGAYESDTTVAAIYNTTVVQDFVINENYTGWN